jgi:glycosyltransferase involved in cell wall biosynthesis
VGHRLDFRGEISRDAVKDLLLTHDILVFPSIGVEAYALGLLEGCAAGILIVTSALGGPQEYLRHEQNALVHEPGDAAGLAAAISRIQQDPALAETLTAGALATAAAHDMNRIVDQVERLLEEQIA